MTRIWITFCAVVTLVFSNLAMADWFLSSDTKMMIEQAEAGDAMAQYKVGVAYDFGKGAPRDVVKAKNGMSWLRIRDMQRHKTVWVVFFKKRSDMKRHCCGLRGLLRRDT